jgi:hypothetical protein
VCTEVLPHPTGCGVVLQRQPGVDRTCKHSKASTSCAAFRKWHGAYDKLQQLQETWLHAASVSLDAPVLSASH